MEGTISYKKKDYHSPETETVKTGAGVMVDENLNWGSEGGDPWGQGAAKKNAVAEEETEDNGTTKGNPWSAWDD